MSIDGNLYRQENSDDSATPNDDIISFSAILSSIRRGIWIVVAVTFLCVGVAYYYSEHVAVPIYSATASIVLETDETSFISFDETTGQLSRDALTLNTQIGVLRGVDLMERVVHTLELDHDPEFNPWANPLEASAESLDDDANGNFDRENPGGGTAVGQASSDSQEELGTDLAVRILQSAVQVRNLPDSFIFEITVTTTDPSKSKEIADAIAEVYILEQVERKISETQRAAEWLTSRVAELQVELQVAETRVEDFRFTANDSRTEEIIRLERLTSEADSIRTLYRYLLSRLQEMIVQEGLQRPDARVLSSAMLPLSPSAPRPTLLMAAAAAVGVFLGLVVIFFREGLDRTIRSREVMERLTRLPVVGQTPKVGFFKRRSKLKGLMGSRALLHHESIERLATTLLIGKAEGTTQTMVVLSPNEGDGKTTLVMSMAKALSKRGLRTLVIDADMRRRGLSKATRFEHAGLVPVLTGTVPLEEAVQKNDVLGADILGVPGKVDERAYVQEISTVEALYFDVEPLYDVVIVDTPPIMAVADALPFALEAQSVFLVARWAKTRSDDIMDALRLLRQVEISPRGIVVTGVQNMESNRSNYAKYIAHTPI